MLKSTGVGIKGGCFEAQLSSGLAPANDSCENLSKNFLRLSGLETKTRRRFERKVDGRIFLILSAKIAMRQTQQARR
jgi:hypothetical protein